MRCPECDTENPLGNGFCQQCGTRLAPGCVRCGHTNPPSAHFCGNCGVELTVRPAAATSAERKQVTILFADIVGSTQSVVGLDPEEAIARLKPTLDTMCDCARRFGSTIIRVQGDGLMAVFGAPVAHERHALLGCSAALAMQELLLAQPGSLPIRLGLHSGIVVAGSLDESGEDARGATVHLASRMQDLAGPGEICITADTFREVRGYCDVRRLGLRSVKGFGDAVDVYRLVGHKHGAVSERFRSANLAPFLHRDAELAFLEDALAGAAAGQGRAIGIAGPPGAGKSRLCFEFSERCRARGIPVVETRALAYAHATPFQPILELLRSFFRIRSDDPASAARSRIARTLLTLDHDFEKDLGLVYDFLGVAAEDHKSRLDPRARQARIQDILRRTVRLAGASTSVVVFEDLHWVDAASAELIDTVVNAVADTRILLLLNFRPSHAAAWRSLRHYSELSLREFTPDETLTLVRDLVGDAPETLELSRRLAERSGGNPFFAEEMITALVQSGALKGRAGRYEATAAMAEETLPATVQAAIAARIDRLSPQDKEVLQVAAVVGMEFAPAIVGQVLQMPIAIVESALSRLCEAEMVRQQFGSGSAHIFRHPLIHEVAYATPLRSRKVALHAATAAALTDFYQDRLDEYAGLIAYHYEAAGQNLSAAKFGLLAARWVGKTDSAQALQGYKMVRSWLEREPHSATTDRQRIFASGQILNFGWREGMTADEAKPYAEEAQQWALNIGDKLALSMILVAYGRIIASSGAADDYVRLVRQALAIISDESNRARFATLNAALSQAYCFAGLLEPALAASDEALRGVPHLDSREQEILGFNVEHWILSLRGRILVLLGRYGEAEELMKTLFAVPAAERNPVVHYIPHWCSVELAWATGDAASAHEHTQNLAKIAEHSAIPYLQVHALESQGLACSTSGDYQAGIRHLEAAVRFARKSKGGWENAPSMLAHLADVHYRAGDYAAASSAAQEAIVLAKERTARAAECHASIVCAAVASARGEDGAEHLRRSESLLAESSARIFEPFLTQTRLMMCSPDRLTGQVA